MRLKWGDAGVSISPELKLLQYHIGQPLELDEKNVFTSEKGGIIYQMIMNFIKLSVIFR